MDFEKKIGPSMCVFVGVKWCIIVAFMILPKTLNLQNMASEL